MRDKNAGEHINKYSTTRKRKIMNLFRGRIPRIAVPFAILSVSLLLACFAFVVSRPVSAVPSTMNFQGRLADASGAIVPDGLYNMQFRLFTASSGGSSVWDETRETTNRVQVTNGLFSTKLGEVNPISASLFASGNLYFEITLATPATATCNTASCASWESAMTPRHQMGTSAYAFNSDTLDGLDSTAFAAASGSANYIQNGTSPQTADFNITGTGVAAILQAATFDRATSGALALGSTNATSINIGKQSGSNIQTAIYGTTLIKPTSGNDNSVALQVQSANATPLLTVNSTNSSTNVGGVLNVTNSTAKNTYSMGVDSTTNTFKLGMPKIGSASSGSLTHSGNAGYVSSSKYNSGPGGTVDSLILHLQSVDTAPNNHARAAIYADNAGSPGTLLSSATAATTVVTAGWNTIPLGTTLTLTPNTNYWLAFKLDGNATQFRYVAGTGTVSSYDSETYSSNFPASYTSDVTDAALYSVYAPYITVTNTADIQPALSMDGNGNITLRPYHNDDDNGYSNGVFNIQDAAGTKLLTMNTGARFLGILGSLQVNGVDTGYNMSIQGQGTTGTARIFRDTAVAGETILDLQSNVGGSAVSKFKVLGNGDTTLAGSLTFSGTTNTTFLTPVGSSVATKINIPIYDPGSFNQVIALGLSSAAQSTSRAISLFDARTTAHQPTLAIFSPDENNTVGFSWDGSNTTPTIKSSTNYISLQGGNKNIALAINDTTNNLAELRLGNTTDNTGRISFTNYTNAYISGIQSGVSSESYVSNLMTARGTAGQCLAVASTGTGYQQLGYSDCLSSSSGIQNGTSAQTANFNITGTGTVGTLQATTIDRATSGALTIGGANATSISLVDNAVLGAGLSLTLTGGNTASRPAGTDGMVYYDTDTKQLLVYNGSTSKWQADKSDAILVAASNSSALDKASADYLADGNTGAANDGDQVQINLALTAGSGKKVVLLAGTYTVDASISIPNNTTLTGVGNGTVLTIPNAFSTDLSIIVNSDQTTGAGVAVKNLKISGNKANQSGLITHIGIHMSGIGASWGTNRPGANIENVNVFQTYQGSGSSWGGGVVIDNAENSVIKNSTSSDNSYYGFEDSSSYGNIYSELSASTNGQAGIYLESSISSSVTSGYFNSNSQGILLNNATNLNISNNIVEDSTGTGGIRLEYTNTSIISNNHVYDSGSATTNNGLYFLGSDKNQISSNKITDTSCTTNCYAINISDAGSDNNYLSGNTFSTASGTAVINDSGTGTIYANQSKSAGGLDVLYKQTNSTVAFQIQNATADPQLTVDTINSTLVIGNTTNVELLGGNLNSAYGGIGQFGNLLTKSEIFNNANWVKTNVTVTADTITAPNQASTADVLATSVAGGSATQTSSTAPTNDNYNFSIWLKTASGTQAVDLRIDGATTGTGTVKTVTATTTWQRFSVTQNTNGFTGNIKVAIFPGGTAGSGTVHAWGAQLSKSSVPQVYTYTDVNTQSANIGTVGGRIYAQGPNAGLTLQAQDGNGSASTIYSATGELSFYTGQNIRGVLTASGRFGIGLNPGTPGAQMEVTSNTASLSLFQLVDNTAGGVGTINVMNVADEGAVTFRNRTDSSTALLIQNAAGTAFFTANSSASTILVGNGTDGITLGANGIVLTGTARGTRTVTLAPEYQGAAFTADGSNNNGSLSSDFCSGSSRQNINPISPSTNPCASTDTHNYYQWTTTQATSQDYDVYVRYQMPSDYDTGSMTNLSIWGWGTSTSTEQVTIALFSPTSTTTECNSTAPNAITANGSWNQGTSASPLGSCTIAAGDTVTFRVHVQAGQNNYARAGEINFTYKSKF